MQEGLEQKVAEVVKLAEASNSLAVGPLEHRLEFALEHRLEFALEDRLEFALEAISVESLLGLAFAP